MRIQRYLISGILTFIPLWITWWVFKTVLAALSYMGGPLARKTIEPLRDYPRLQALAEQGWFQSATAVLITLGFLLLLGWLANRVVGERLLALVEKFISGVPLIQQVYGSSKKLISALQEKPEGVQRVVLLEFPHDGMKTVGLVTRVLTEEGTGRSLAAVYVPTTPNPTSGYLEIVPVENLVDTHWSLDEAMSFVISGGAVAPSKIQYDSPPPTPGPPSGTTGQQ